jgi:ABC-type transport system involved in multi-copper enzyme maturation permease subunit
MGIIMIVLITNEFSYNTVRHNIFNGLSRTEFLLSKVYIAIIFSIAATLLVFISGTILGLIYSSNISFQAFFSKTSFLFGYFVEILTYLLFAMMIGLLIKRTGFAIGLLFVYPIFELIISQKIPENIQPFLPVNAMNHVLRTPNTSLIQYSSPEMDIELQTAIQGQDIIVALLYCGLFIGISLLVMRKRDL